MRAVRWLVVVMGTLLGIGLLFYPRINEAVYDHHARTEILAFYQQVEEERSSTKVAATLYPELLKAMQDYNRHLAESGQSELTSPTDYERPPLSLEDYGFSPDAAIGTISIPSIDLELPLYLGAGKEQMARGAAVLGGTSLPIGGRSTNCVIAGHRGFKGIPYFRNLDRLDMGDEVIVTNFWGTLTYSVTGTQIIQPDDLDAILIENGKDKITLLTCHPYTVGTQRLLIFCERINNH